MRPLVVFGTRPEAIKLAPIIRLMQASSEWDPIVVSSGQHREMLDQVVNDLAIKVDLDLSIMRESQTLAYVTSAVITSVEGCLKEFKPELVLVQGDTTTAMGATFASFYQAIPVGHVEAGLRSGNFLDPFPEEMNRQVVSKMATWHFAPTQRSSENLRTEGVDEAAIEVTGNTVIDNLKWVIEQGLGRSSFKTDSSRLLVTLHRRENQGENMAEIASALRALCGRGDVEVVLPLHMSPQVRRVLQPELDGVSGMNLIEPLSYLDFVRTMNDADVILTDSGGVQEEAPSLGKPVLVLRQTTERPEGIEAGSALLVGTNADVIAHECARLLDDQAWYQQMAHVKNPYGDGTSALQILERLQRDLTQVK